MRSERTTIRIVMKKKIINIINQKKLQIHYIKSFGKEKILKFYKVILQGLEVNLICIDDVASKYKSSTLKADKYKT